MPPTSRWPICGRFILNFTEGRQLLENGKASIATWALDESQIKITFTDESRGAVLLRQQKGVFTGQQTEAAGRVFTWTATPVVIVAIWEIETEERTHNRKLTLYSNGKFDDPYEGYRWFTAPESKLTFDFPDDPAVFTVDSTGRLMKGRWLRGAYFNGRQLPIPASDTKRKRPAGK
jgi:hypothetical protein